MTKAPRHVSFPTATSGLRAPIHTSQIGHRGRLQTSGPSTSTLASSFVPAPTFSCGIRRCELSKGSRNTLSPTPSASCITDRELSWRQAPRGAFQLERCRCRYGSRHCESRGKPNRRMRVGGFTADDDWAAGPISFWRSYSFAFLFVARSRDVLVSLFSFFSFFLGGFGLRIDFVFCVCCVFYSLSVEGDGGYLPRTCQWDSMALGAHRWCMGGGTLVDSVFCGASDIVVALLTNRCISYGTPRADLVVTSKKEIEQKQSSWQK